MSENNPRTRITSNLDQSDAVGLFPIASSDYSGVYPFEQMGYVTSGCQFHVSYNMDEEENTSFSLAEYLEDEDVADYKWTRDITIPKGDRMKFARFLREVADSIEQRVLKEN